MNNIPESMATVRPEARASERAAAISLPGLRFIASVGSCRGHTMHTHTGSMQTHSIPCRRHMLL